MKSNHAFITHGDQDEFDPAKWTMNITARLPTRAPETKLNVLIVGAGFSGLVSALECWRNGHNVIGILDRNQGPLYTGMKPCQRRANLVWLTSCRRRSHHFTAVFITIPGPLA
jgi:hypothetical protein